MSDPQPVTEFRLDVLSVEGVPMRLVLDPSGRDHNGEIAGSLGLFDLRYRDLDWTTPDGQIIPGYGATTLMGHGTHALTTWGDVPAWNLSAATMGLVSTWIGYHMCDYANTNNLIWRSASPDYSWKHAVLVPATGTES